MIRIVALIERYYHCNLGFVYMRDGQDYKVMNETFRERRLRREHLHIIIAAPQPSTFFSSSVCLTQTRIVAFGREESSLIPSTVSRQNTPFVRNIHKQTFIPTFSYHVLIFLYHISYLPLGHCVSQTHLVLLL